MGTTSTETAVITFRDMTEADVQAVVQIEAESFHDAWNENMVMDELNNALTNYLIMEANVRPLVMQAFGW